MMEDWRYVREDYRDSLRSRSRSPMRKLGLRDRDRDYSPRRMYEIVARSGGHEARDEYCCGKQCDSEIDMARIRGREYEPRGCGGGGDDGREYDRMRVGDCLRSPRRRDVDGLRDREYGGRGGGEYDRMGLGDRSRSPKGREGEVLIEREYRGCGGGGEYDRMSFSERRHSSKGREVEVSREREYRGGGGGDYDRTRVGDRRHSPRGREVEVLRKREYSDCGGDREYDRMRVGGRNYSPRGTEVEVVRDGREYEKARVADAEYSLRKRDMSATWSVAEHERKIIDHNCFPNQQEMKQACIPEEYVERIAESRYSLMHREIDGIQSVKEYEGSRMLDQETEMFPMMERRLMDEHMPEQVKLRRDYDRAPPDVVNKEGDHDGGIQWSMRLSRDDDRGLKRDNTNTNGLLERSYYQFDDSLSSMASTPLKFQRNILAEHWKADTCRSNREFGVCDARLYSERDNSSKQFMDVGLSEHLLDSNGMLVKSDSGRGFSYSCPSDKIVSKHCGVGSCGHLLTPHPENSYHKYVGLHGDCYLNKLTGDRPFMGDENTLNSLKDEYDFIPSSSLSNVFPTMSSDGYVEEVCPLVKEADNRGSGGVVFNCGISGKPLLYDRHGQNPVSGSPIINARQSNDNRYYSLSYLTLPEEHKYPAYQKADRRENDHIGAGSCDIYGNSCDFVENHGYQDTLRAQNQELDMDREKCQFSKRDHSSDGSHQWNLDPYLIRRSMPDYANAVESSHLKKQDMDSLDSVDPHLQYDTRIHDDSMRNQHLEYHDHRKGHGCNCHHDRSEVIRSGKYYANLDGLDHTLTQKLFAHNMNLSESPEMLLRHRRSISGLSSDALQLSSSLNSAHQTKDERYIKKSCGADELDFLAVSKKSRYSSSIYEETANGCTDLSSRLTNRKLSQPLENFLSKDAKSSGRDIKSRLGPSPQDAHASHSEAKKQKSSVKKRLGHPPNTNQVTLPWIKNLTAPKLSLIQKDSGGNHDQEEDLLVGNGCCRKIDSNLNAPKLSNIQQGSERRLDQGGDCLVANEIFRKGEPAENSEEFKQLVHSNFFKFVKQLNETLARRRKFMDHGKYGPLKCLVCGSNSPEFPDTESLVMHALSCDKVGSKCEHLGFHKALCVLMGWRSAEVPSDSWVCERLTGAETSALKDDLIIWPPVVVVHNSTIPNIQEKQITLSVEELEAKLRDMRFGNKTKVTLGRPAYQGTMVVRFGPTFSALQEAERLHKIFLDFNHGRTCFLQLTSSGNSHDELPVEAGDELHPFLYGYIGVADDLDKLDFEIKRRSLIKSKTEIQLIADASAKKEVTAEASGEKGVTADASGETEVAADASGKKEVSADASGEKGVTTDASGKKEVTADASGEKGVTADASGEKGVTADASGEKEVTADASGKKEVSADASGEKGVTTDASGKKEVTADASGKKEVTADASDKKEVSADASGEKEVTADASGKKELTADASGKKELTAYASGKKEVSVGATDNNEAIADATFK